MRRARGTRRSIFGLVTATTLLVLGSGASAAGEPAPFFSLRLEGTAVRAAAVTQARNLNPAPAYSFANVTSIEDLDGSRGLQMKAVGTTNDPGDLGGVALFAPTTPTRGAADFPNYSEAFFPAFEDVGQTTVAEKCAVNNTAKEEPACAEQPGPYALARVVPEQLAPAAVGIGRNVGDDGNAETFSRSEIAVGDAGEVIGTQVNAGRDLTVPGTPIRVTSFRTESRVVSKVGSVTVEGECDGTVQVNGEVIDSNDELQTLVAAVAGAGIKVEYTPPTQAKVVETFGGTKEIGCSGPRFVVSDGSSGVSYTYGRTFATGSPGSDKPTFDSGGSAVDDVLGDVVPPPPAPGGSAEVPDAPEPAPAEAPPAPDGGRTEAAADAAPPAPEDETAAPGLVARRIETLPLAAATTAAATALPLGVWLLLGVVGSLSRGYTRLRLPPFRD